MMLSCLVVGTGILSHPVWVAGTLPTHPLRQVFTQPHSFLMCMCLAVLCCIPERTFHRPQEFSLHATFLLVFYSANSRHPVLPYSQLCWFNRALLTKEVHWAPPGFPVPAPWPENSLMAGRWGHQRAHMAYFPSLRITVLHCLMSSTLKMVVWCVLLGF